MTSEQALQKVIDEVLTPLGLDEDAVAVYAPESPLVSGDEVWPVLSREGSDAVAQPVEQTTWFSWVALTPYARFAHPTQFIRVDDATGAVEAEDQAWYAVVNGEELIPATDGDDPRRVFGHPVHPDAAGNPEDVFVEPKLVIDASSRDKGGTNERAGEGETEEFCEGAVAVIANGWQNNLGTRLDADRMASELSVREYIPHKLSPHPSGNAATKDSILGALDNLAGDRETPLCQVLFYYTGHGASGNLVMGSAQTGSVQIGIDEIAGRISAIDACEFTIILDCCESGLFIYQFEEILHGVLDKRCKRGTVFTACAATELAWTDVSGGGSYTNALLERIRQAPRGETIDFAESGTEFLVPELGVFRTQEPQSDFITEDQDCVVCGCRSDDDCPEDEDVCTVAFCDDEDRCDQRPVDEDAPGASEGIGPPCGAIACCVVGECQPLTPGACDLLGVALGADKTCEANGNECGAFCTEHEVCDNGQYCDGLETCDLETNTCIGGLPRCTQNSCDEVADLCFMPCTENCIQCTSGEDCPTFYACMSGRCQYVYSGYPGGP